MRFSKQEIHAIIDQFMIKCDVGTDLSTLDTGRERDYYYKWRGLLHLEEIGADFSLRQMELHELLTESGRPGMILVKPPLDIEDEREIILVLRDRLRERLGLPVLSQDERDAFTYTEVERAEGNIGRFGDKRTGVQSPAGDFSEKVDFVVQYLRDNEPELLRIIKEIEVYNQSLGTHNFGPDDHLIIRQEWIFKYIEHLAHRILPDGNKYHYYNIGSAVYRRFRKEFRS